MNHIPVNELIAIPLAESLVAQDSLNGAVMDFIGKNLREDGSFETVEFATKKPNGDVSKIVMPTILFSEIPSLSLKNVGVNFQVSISGIKRATDSKGVQMYGKLSSGAETDIKYGFSVTAEDNGRLSGFKRLQAFLMDNITVSTKEEQKEKKDEY
jgi:hypothetical protein